MAADEFMSDPRTETGRSLGAEVSTRMVQLLRDYTGRGPTKARTYVHEDLIVCVLRDNLSKAEHAIAEHIGVEAVLAQRKAFQNALRDEAVAIIEELTGRSVSAFMSDNHVQPDVAIEAFLLEHRAA
jgi:uncharacterized protein YbcI